jgi:hypothetical protein
MDKTRNKMACAHVINYDSFTVNYRNQTTMIKKSTLRMFLLKLLIGVLLTACTGATQLDNAQTPSSVTTQPQLQDSGGTITLIPQIILTQEATMPGPSPSPETLDDNPLVRQAKEDLAGRLDVPTKDIELIQHEEVFWRDASLGCPQPGMVYAQVITAGYLITLEANGQKYEYHADASQYVFLCETKETPIEPVPLMPIAPHGKPPKCKRTPCP